MNVLLAYFRVLEFARWWAAMNEDEGQKQGVSKRNYLK